ncbi:MAG: hypothetical protein KF712_03870 [Akkermansiaceae bacterium]|nr:hypothetical protein [Akkermansiaceae bacterium]
MNFNSLDIPSERLLLDPNNYRFHDLATYRPVPNHARYPEGGVQERALALLQTTDSFDLESLKDSITSNTYVPLERVVVELFDGEGEEARYLVVEGNRRVAAVKTLLAEQAAGSADIPEATLLSIATIPSIEITGTPEERHAYKQKLMAIRHVAGIKEWGPYQQAKLVVELYEQNQNFSLVAQEIGITSREVARRYRASKALQQMEEDEEMGEYASPKLYALFHEAMAQPLIREWLGFSDISFTAVNEENREAFYELLSPRSFEGETLPPKLSTARHVRAIRSIVNHPTALATLLEPERLLEDAIRESEVENTPDDQAAGERALSQALRALRLPGFDVWFDPTARARILFSELRTLVDRLNTVMPNVTLPPGE